MNDRLRDQLDLLRPEGMNPDPASAAIAGGKRVRRRRTVAAGLAAVVVAAGIGVAALNLPNLGGPAPIPAAPPSTPAHSGEPTPTTSDPTPTITPTPTTPVPSAPALPARNEIPGKLGTLPEGFRLPSEGTPAGEHSTAWQYDAIPGLGCTPDVFQSTRGLLAARAGGIGHPDAWDGEGVAVFATAADAQWFLAELRERNDGCSSPLPETGGKTLHVVSAEQAGDEAVAVWKQELNETGTPNQFGAVAAYARQGNVVAIAVWSGMGEFRPGAPHADEKVKDVTDRTQDILTRASKAGLG